MISQVGRVLIVFGILIVLMGLILSFGGQIPVINRLGRLPGDIIIKRENFTFYFPWVTCLVISLILFLVLNLFRR